uniref:GPI ethanolamine phosphate transferase 1 n=2 Tax=Lygus hesperus TaxID=30085 RepID=A0A0A9ZG84_LYGHE
MAGHKSKPFSESYRKHIQMMDEIIRKIVKIFENYFNDHNTAYVFTSDHGMTNWGSHGAGSDEETQTPLIVWGSGVKSGMEPHKSDEYSFSKNASDCSWNVNLDKKFDVEQADIAVLMSTLLGVDIPTNNMGTLPWRYLDFDSDTLLSAILLNLHQLLLLYQHLEGITRKQVLSPFFQKFPSPDIDQIPLAYAGITGDVVKFVRSIVKGTPESIVLVIADHIKLVKDGINYYQTYFQPYLLFLLCSSFVGLILIIAGRIYLQSTSLLWIEEERQKRHVLYYIYNIRITTIEQFFMILFIMVSGMHLSQSLPFTYYIYAVLPIILWYKAIDFWSLTSIVVQLKSVKCTQVLTVAICLASGVELLYLSFFYRWLLSVGMVALSAFPLTITNNTNFKRAPAVIWTLSCLTLSVFPLLPTVGVAKQTFLVICSGLLWLIIVSVAVNITKDSPIGPQIFSKMTRIQVVLINAAIASVIFVDVFAASNSAFRLPGRIFSWTILFLNFGVLVLLPDSPSARMFNLILAFGIPFMMLSISFESLFFPILTANMVSWTLLEKATSVSTRRILFSHHVISYLRTDEVRRGFFFLFFIIFSFFGIGNIDSVNSFDINWVRCFIDVFSPFTMTALIVLKTVMPFFLVACSLRLIVIHTRVDGVKILLIAMVMCEIMNMLFLFMVTNTGSWLDIGKSISHYVIMEVSSLCLVLLYNAAGYALAPVGVADVV